MANSKTYQQQHRRTNEAVGQDCRFDELDMYGLYRSPHHESSFLVNQIDNAGEVMLAARREPEFDEEGHEIEGSSETLDAYWVGASLRTTQARDIDPIDLTEAQLDHLPLAARERLTGLKRERRRHREKALAADLIGTNRATSHREALVTEYRERRRSHRENWVVEDEPGLMGTDPFDELDDAGAEQVRDAVVHLAERLVTGPSISALEHRLALKVAGGQDLISATSNLQDQLYQEAGIVQPIAAVPAVPSTYNVEADIQGEVLTLWQPKASNQQQVGLIGDDTGRIKFTVWIRSNQSVILHEGDTVRIMAGKVGRYNGQATLAADSETRITVLDRGNGPAPRGDVPNVDWTKYDGRFKGVQHHRACTIPTLTDPGVSRVSRPIHRPWDRLDVDDGKYAASHWLKAVEIYDEDGAIPIPNWWKSQPNVVQVSVPDAADSETIGQHIRERCRQVRAAGCVPDAPAERSFGELEVESDGSVRSLAVDAQSDCEERSVRTDGGNTRTLWVRLPEDSVAGAERSDGSTDAHPIGLPSTSTPCPACEHDRAYFELKQLRAADEAPTRLFTCRACGHRWRDDD